eukprot:CAMPEP_0172303592 /NCGR_PEP_ID=MMETSP1058-20130122/5115_1 /TAXON_ID=83371 /ORGANISM="Detonula confervacea, Strain CCMP 353" /LENGTH=604 /DNA_ID=CAMNT_0013014471 /DNA_START=96 /DNA_END=1910 /DNA_ORIENTATION=-
MKKFAPLLSLLPLTNALPPPQRIPDILERIKQQQQQEGIQLTQGGASKDSAIISDDDVETLYFHQRLDHFSQEDEGKLVTFQQRYFYTSRYVQSGTDSNNNGGVNEKVLAFLCVGGEGPSMDPSVLVDSVHCTGDMIGLADKLFNEHNYDVHLFALEHRYYGESFPPQKGVGYLRGEGEEDEFQVDYTNLSSRQAVKDIVGFVKSPVALKHLNPSHDSETENTIPWITFGGSYPGMLSAWSHLLHPEAIFAAVSSSAPVQAQLDFSQYNDHVGSDLEDEFVGGSKECHAIVKEGHEQVVELLEGHSLESDGDGDSSEDGVDQVATLFNVCDGAESLRASRRNQEIFVGDGLIMVPAQGNDPSCTGEICNIKGLCDTIVKERKSNPNKSSMEILAHISKLQSNTCKNVSWKSYLDYFSTPLQQNANDRSWMYQTCSEFGFYQTCNEDSHCPYAKGYHDVSRDLEFCQTAFGIEPDIVKKNIDSTLSYYGGWSLTPNTGEHMGPNNHSSMLENGDDTLHGQERIIFVTGDVDPWTELSFTKGNKDHPSISVHGASHHFWTHKVKDSDSDCVVTARQTIYDTVSDWVGVSTHLLPSAGGEILVRTTE